MVTNDISLRHEHCKQYVDVPRIETRSTCHPKQQYRQNSAQFSNRIVPSNSVRNIVNVGGSDRIIDLALIPFIRARKIYFKATGLKPNTKFTPFFDGTDVSTFCREETFVRWADREEDDGNLYIRQTTHPDGSSDLISDANNLQSKDRSSFQTRD